MMILNNEELKIKLLMFGLQYKVFELYFEAFWLVFINRMYNQEYK
nr:MAG TPA: hypothetical protein [Caudoviricetes sp.]